MCDSGRVKTGLMIFMLLVACPGNADQCVLPAEQMRAEHMLLLNVWHDEAIRTGNRDHDVKIDDKSYEKSLQNTCMQCHTSKVKFCDECHSKTSVTPDCWDCHLVPDED